MANRKTINEKTFYLAKMLLKAGATHEEVSETLDISPASVYRIKQAETFEEYKNICAARALACKEKRNSAPKAEEPKPDPKPVINPTVVRVEATHYMMEELRKLNDTMTLISNKLALIVDQLT